MTDSTEESFNYDLQKLNTNKFKVLCSESLTPDTAKRYLRIDNSDEKGLYVEETNDNLTGVVISNDNSIIMPTDKFTEMLSNQKNFFLQNTVNRNAGLGNAITSIGAGLVGGTLVGGLTGALIGGVSGAVKTGINYAKDKITENLTVDNLKNAPASIQNAKGNVVFENMYSKYGPIIEEYDIIENEKIIINDNMCLYGFTYNNIDNVKNVDNIRKYYNYVQADIEQVEGVGVNISDNIHNKIKQIYANGVRFWNTDNALWQTKKFDYSKENYERWLED